MCIIAGCVVKFVKFAMIYRLAGDKTRSAMQHLVGSMYVYIVGCGKHYTWMRCNVTGLANNVAPFASFIFCFLFLFFSFSPFSYILSLPLTEDPSRSISIRFAYLSWNVSRIGSTRESAWDHHRCKFLALIHLLGSNPFLSPGAKDTLSSVSSGH